VVAAQGRYWRVVLSRKRDAASFSLAAVPGELEELEGFKLELPLARWNAVVKQAEADRKLLGGILLDLATAKDQVARVVASDRLLTDLQRVLRDATVALVEAGALVIAPAAAGEAEEEA
jgi:hypothetical protein